MEKKPGRLGWILAGIVLLLVVLLIGVVLGWLFTARSFGGRHGDLEEQVEHWVEDAVADSGVTQVFGPRVSYPYADQYQKGDGPVNGNISRLKIHWISGSVKVHLWDGDHVVLEESGTERSEELLRWRLRDGVLDVQYCEAGSYSDLPAKDLTVKLPASEAASMRILVESISADCSVAEMELRSLDFESTSGNLDAEGSFTEFSAGTVSGEITFLGQTMDADVETTSGDTDLTFTETPDELTCEAVSGDLTLTLNGGRGFRMEYETVSGDLNGNFPLERRDGAYVYLPEGGKATAEFEVETVSGDVKLQRAE